MPYRKVGALEACWYMIRYKLKETFMPRIPDHPCSHPGCCLLYTSFLQLLLLKSQHRADLFQPDRQAIVRRPYQRAFPGTRIKVILDRITLNAVCGKIPGIMPAQPDGQANPFKAGVVGPLRDGFIGQSDKDAIRYGVSTGEVIYGDGTAIHGYAEQQYIEIGRLNVFVYAAFSYIHAAPPVSYTHLDVYKRQAMEKKKGEKVTLVATAPTSFSIKARPTKVTVDSMIRSASASKMCIRDRLWGPL